MSDQWFKLDSIITESSSKSNINNLQVQMSHLPMEANLRIYW